MSRITVFNFQNKSNDGTLIKQDLLTEQQVLEKLTIHSAMESEDINFAIERMKSTNETLFIEDSGGTRIFLNTIEAILH